MLEKSSNTSSKCASVVVMSAASRQAAVRAKRNGSRLQNRNVRKGDGEI